ncbi:MAG: outer membrane protein assembly factor BamC [Gammaproteobacteria bacterium]|nr:outer membrane protein assembly factor BamC [Gammaproteobacteria bacterium]
MLPDKRTEYRKAETLPDLEVPPDLSTAAIQDRMAIPEGGSGATYSTYQERAANRQRTTELRQAEGAAFRLLENEAVLAVPGVTAQVWPKLREFWAERDYKLELDDEELGVMETGWFENQQALTRDRFKIFAEPGKQPGTTILYVSHIGEALTPEGEGLAWTERPRDVELESGLAGRLQEHLTGIPADAAPTTAVAARSAPTAASAAAPAAGRSQASGGGAAELISAGEGKLYLSVEQDFADAWNTTGIALERAGIPVDDADRNNGVFRIRYAPPTGEEPGKKKKGVWNKLAFWKKDSGGADADVFQLSLTGVGGKTELVVLDSEGRWDTSDEAGQVLSVLYGEFNSGQI